MNNSSHLTSILKPKSIDIIRDGAAKGEKDGKLTKTQLNLMYEQHWFKMLMPSFYGGLQMQLPEVLQTVEALAWTDGSAGWVVASSSLAGWMSGFSDGEAMKKVLKSDKLMISGSLDPTGSATESGSGYTLTGKWRHIAASPDAAAFVVNCLVGKKNEQEVLSFLLLAEEVTIASNWNAMGLSATASNDIEVKNLTVGKERAFKINGSSPDGSLYNYPFTQLAEAMLSVSICGMVTHFTDLCYTMFSADKNMDGIPWPDDGSVQDAYDKYTQKMLDARTKLYYAIELSWQACVHNQTIKTAVLYKVSAAARELSKRARECADALYPYCGMTATDLGTEINRVCRDLHTASHHNLLLFGEIVD